MPKFLSPETVVKGTAVNLVQLLKEQNEIPDYQRDYVWKKATVEQLWDDLLSHYHSNTVGDELKSAPEGYFLGPMVVVKPDDSSAYEIIDGQQRLTTLSTIASVCLERARKGLPNGEHKTGLETHLRSMLGRYVGGAFEANLLFARSDIKDFYVDSVIQESSLAEKRKIWDSSKYVTPLLRKSSTEYRIKQSVEVGYEKLEEFLKSTKRKKEKEKRLLAFLQLLTECIVVLRIRAQSHSNAYVIFESLNNRGIPLTQADLIKNELLKRAIDGDRNLVIEAWTAVRDSLQSHDTASLPEFLHYSYLSRHGRVKATSLFPAVKNLVTNSQSARTYVEGLKVDAEALDRLVHGQQAWSVKTKGLLADVRETLGVKMLYPYLLAAYREHQGDKSGFERFVRLGVNFAFRYMKVADGDVGQLVNAVSDASEKLRKGESSAVVAKTFSQYSKDSDFEEQFATLLVANTKLAYFVMYGLESAQMKGALPVEHGKEQNLEHIMPKSPKKNAWPEATKLKEKDPEVFKDNLWKIGNLLALPEDINKSLKNKAIGEKLHGNSGKNYQGCNLAMPKDVEQFLVNDKWTLESIDLRQKKLAKAWACKAWPLTGK